MRLQDLGNAVSGFIDVVADEKTASPESSYFHSPGKIDRRRIRHMHLILP